MRENMEKNSNSRSNDQGFHRGRRSRTAPSSSSSSSSSNWRSHAVNEKGNSADPTTDVPTLVGTCPDMCPAKEQAQRERLRDLSVFERLNGNPGKTSPSLAVKKFCRTISTNDVHASDLRPPSVLQNTLKYLLNLVESSDHPFEVVHDFVFDRTRSIRQDLSIQNVVDSPAIYMYEQMIKFHIISHQKLSGCGNKPDISSLYHLNMEQLMKCLLSLLNIYDINRSPNSINKNEAEYYSFYVLLHLGCKIPTMGNSLSVWFRQLPFSVLHSKEMQFCRTILRYFRMGDYKRFFSTTAAEATHLQLCLMEPLLNEGAFDISKIVAKASGDEDDETKWSRRQNQAEMAAKLGEMKATKPDGVIGGEIRWRWLWRSRFGVLDRKWRWQNQKERMATVAMLIRRYLGSCTGNIIYYLLWIQASPLSTGTPVQYPDD